MPAVSRANADQPVTADSSGKLETVRRLREQLRREQLRKGFSRQQPSTSTSHRLQPLSRILPDGVPQGGITEWLGEVAGGAATLSLWMARQICGETGILAVVDRRRQIYPLAMAGAGIDLQRTLLLHPSTRKDEIWSLVQSLRCRSIAAVWSSLDWLSAREYRCLQLAAEESGSVGLLVRPASMRSQPSWASIRLRVTPLVSAANCGRDDGLDRGLDRRLDRRLDRGLDRGSNRCFEIESVNCRQGTRGSLVTVERDALTGDVFTIDRGECHEPRAFCLAEKLASPPARRRAAGA